MEIRSIIDEIRSLNAEIRPYTKIQFPISVKKYDQKSIKDT
jgi:hypothetical protein